MKPSEKLAGLRDAIAGQEPSVPWARRVDDVLYVLPRIVEAVAALETIRDVRFNEGREMISGRSAVEVAATALDALDDALQECCDVAPITDWGFQPS